MSRLSLILLLELVCFICFFKGNCGQEIQNDQNEEKEVDDINDDESNDDDNEDNDGDDDDEDDKGDDTNIRDDNNIIDESKIDDDADSNDALDVNAGESNNKDQNEEKEVDDINDDQSNDDDNDDSDGDDDDEDDKGDDTNIRDDNSIIDESKIDDDADSNDTLDVNAGESNNKEFPEKCLDGLGCYQTGPPFYEPPHRPLSLLPFDQKDIGTKFLFYSHLNAKVEHVIQEHDDFHSSHFDCWMKTYVIIPGYNSVLQSNDSYHLLKNTLLGNLRGNAIIVDWSSSNQPPYVQAVANARVVATQLAKFIQYVIDEKCIYAETVHLIGHGLGAHLAGWTGSQITALGRITGLDPAGEYFYEAPPEVRLSDKDAIFVDVIHTNGGTKVDEGIGLEEAIGHLDFYPNGGMRQPGCFNASGQQESDYDAEATRCSHQRALSLYISSIQKGNCRMMGMDCDSYEHFTQKKCRRPNRRYPIFFVMSAEMGVHSKKPYHHSIGQKYYLKTNAESPYCLNN